MNNSWCMKALELLDRADGFLKPVRGKPMNTRTRKTVWKERRRRANMPRPIKRRIGAK